ncbi:hypothetical protein [Streptomyces sp. NPDC058861]|uniref:hypothetical protein n=1 Tax=Streptomyces sp. NPDC058861 TaxID=3346653 RepID=UPI0036BF3896
MSVNNRQRPKPEAQIILYASPAVGLVAVFGGEQHRWAEIALRVTGGFEQREDGTYALRDPESIPQALPVLVDTAERYRATLTVSSRPYLGDYASDLAARLPGAWTTRVEIYSHPVRQGNWVPFLWNSGDLAEAMQHHRVPYAAVLDNGVGTELLLIEHPGSATKFLLGAASCTGFDDNYANAHAPAAVILPDDPRRAAARVEQHFLPAYERALHQRLLATVEDGQARLAELDETWAAIDLSGRDSDGTPLDHFGLTARAEQYRTELIAEVRRLSPHAARLLDRVRPAAAGTTQAAALDRLHQLLHPARPDPPWPAPLTVPRTLSASVDQVVRWRADAPALLHLARADRPPAPASKTTPRLRPALPNPSPTTAQMATPHRRIASLEDDLIRAHETYEPGTVCDPPQTDLAAAFDQFVQAAPEIAATVRALASLNAYEITFLRDLDDIVVTPAQALGTATRIDPLAWWLTQGGEGLVALARRHLPAPPTGTPSPASAVSPARPPRPAQSTPRPRR